MTRRHIEQLRRVGQLLRSLANAEEVHGDLDGAETVSYTHLTLPTILRV